MTDKLVKLVAGKTNQTLEQVKAVTEKYPMAISPFIQKRVEQGTYSLEALKQFSPDIRELNSVEGFITDPTGEENLHPERAVLQTYNNRAAIFLTQKCLVYCRFCFRKDFVGLSSNAISESELQNAINYVASNPSIEDVLLSGGDPLALSNSILMPFMEKLSQIIHLKTIRIHSRAISSIPSRIDDALINFFKGHNKFWYYAHMNHPDDIDHPDVLSAIRNLQRIGIPVLNQCVLLKGVNDNPKVLRRLMLLCYENKVLPYNLYLLDKVKGVSHFDLSLNEVINLYQSLEDLPGPAQPALVYVDSQSRKHRYINTPISTIKEFLSWREL
jgi:glycine amidinotransferase